MLDLLISVLMPVLACPAGQELDGVSGRDLDDLPLTAIQTLATHNSYKRAIPPAEMTLLMAQNPQSGALDYAFPPLTDQLDAGIRALEIDFVHDPDGGRFADPLLARITAGQDGAEAYDPTGMHAPGFKVLHIPDADVRSHCVTLVDCLSEVRDWSRAHPDHAPIMIQFNAKASGIDVPGAAEVLGFDEAAFDALEAEFNAVFESGHLITPDEVRGDHPTLRDGVLAGGWPSLGEARGRIMLVLDERGESAEVYRSGRPSLQGRSMFTLSLSLEADHAGVFVLNDPIADADQIAAALAQGFLVRTRADANTREARENDTRRRDAALASGAHWISTDYYEPRLEWSAYQVSLPEGVSVRCNPVTTAQ